MKSKTIVATAAALFAASTIAAAHAQQKSPGSIKCAGVNACKGQGWSQAGNTLECTQKGGKVL